MSLNMVEQLHKLSEALFVEELGDAQRKRALLALKQSATSREYDSIDRSADADLQQFTSRLHSFRAVKQVAVCANVQLRRFLHKKIVVSIFLF